MNKTNNYVFNNFSSNLELNCINKDQLSVSSIFNLKTDNKIIEPVSNFSSIFKNIFGFEISNKILINNSDFLKSVIYINLYDYFNTKSNSLESRLFAVTSNFKLFELSNDFIFIDHNISFDKKPTFIQSNNKLYIHSSSDDFVLIDSEHQPLNILSMPNIKDIIDFDGYLIFSVTDNPLSVFYLNTDLIENLTLNLDLCPKIELESKNGPILKILKYKNSIYIFQEFSVLKLENIDITPTLKQTCFIETKISANTIQTIDDYIIFNSTSGLYIFDGNDLKQVFENYTKFIRVYNEQSISFNNKYYLKTKFLIEQIYNTVLLEFDLHTNNCSIYKIGEIIDLYKIQTLTNYQFVVALKENNFINLYSLNTNEYQSQEKCIAFNPIIFNSFYQKQITKLKVLGEGHYTLTISTENDEKSFDCYNTTDLNNVSIKGFYFKIKISGLKSFIVKSIMISTRPLGEIWSTK